MVSYGWTGTWMNAAPTELAFCLSHAFHVDPQRGTLGGVVLAMPEIGLSLVRGAERRAADEPEPAAR